MSRSVNGSAKPRVVLVLQGGGALGAYHVGAYQALSEYGFEPNWFCGISIGAINAAILAGNKSNQRLQRLREFWQTISWPEIFSPSGNDEVRSFFKTVSAAQTLIFG